MALILTCRGLRRSIFNHGQPRRKPKNSSRFLRLRVLAVQVKGGVQSTAKTRRAQRAGRERLLRKGLVLIGGIEAAVLLAARSPALESQPLLSRFPAWVRGDALFLRD